MYLARAFALEFAAAGIMLSIDSRCAKRGFQLEFRGVVTEFVVGQGSSDFGGDGVRVVDANDDDLDSKAKAWILQALALYDFDWLLICDDSTYVMATRLIQMLDSGRIDEFRRYDCILTRMDAEIVAKRGLSTWRVRHSPDWLPRLDNDGVFFGGLSPLSMRAAHIIATEDATGRVDLDAGKFSGRFHFYENGIFVRAPQDEFGLWDIDNESNLCLDFLVGENEQLKISAASLLETPGGPCLQIGVLIIATGRYRGFLHDLISSINKNFLPQHDRTIYLFTDTGQLDYPNVKVIRITNQPWPSITLQRYHLFSKHEDIFGAMDHLYYIDADMRVDDHVGEEIISSGLTATRHPIYERLSDPDELPYDRNRDSTAAVMLGAGSIYFCGGFQGGARESFLMAARIIASRVDVDAGRGVTALWHDESHWNRYLIDCPPSRILSSSYCFPETWSDTSRRKITALEKNHDLCRDTNASWPETIIASLDCGLGNQMFQYAHALALARYFGATLELRHGSRGGESFALERYGLRLAESSDVDEGWVDERGGYTVGMEDRVRDLILATGKTRVVVSGYFQNERMFESVAEDVRKKFLLSPITLEDCSDFTPICIQVRRGNYVGSNKFDLCSRTYFEDALRVVRSLVLRPRFFVVSDDLTWCRWLFEGIEDVIVPTSQSEEEGVRIMAGCEAFIISNSTYGWWGAWLSGSKLVISPSPWLGDQDWDVVPSHWIQLPAKGVSKIDNPHPPIKASDRSMALIRTTDEKPVRIYTLCDKRPDFISLQLDALKHLTDPNWQLIVINNASNTELHQNISEECFKFNLRVIEPQKDHSSAMRACHVPLDDVMYSEIQHRRGCISVIMDSDIFLYRPFSFAKCLAGMALAGIFQQRNGLAFPYFWNALLVLDNDAVPDWSELVFAPRCGSDVGGGMNGIFKAEWDFKLLSHTPDIRNEDLSTAVFADAAEYRGDFGVQIIENAFLHYYRGSNWDGRDDDYHHAKTAFLRRVIENPQLIRNVERSPFSYGPFAHSSARYNGNDQARRDIEASLSLLPPAVRRAVRELPGPVGEDSPRFTS